MATITKLLLFFLLALLGLLPWKQAAVTYEATLGRYGADCSGRGVCSFTEAKENFNSRLSYTSMDSTLTMQLETSKFSPSTLQRQLGNQWDDPVNGSKFFVMESDYLLPAALKERLAIPKTLLRIQQGQYNMEVQNGYVIVHFKLK